MSCGSWMGRTLLFRVASGTKLLGVSSNHDISEVQLQLERGTDVDLCTLYF